MSSQSPAVLWRCLLLALLLWGPSVQGESVKLVSFQYPPLVYTEDHRVKGAATALVRAVFQEMGVTVEIEILPWARALQYLQHGQADGVFTIFKNSERQTYLRYTHPPLIEQVITLYVGSGQPVDYDGQLADLAPYRIAVTRAVSYGQSFDAAMVSLLPNLTAVNNEKTKFLLLDKGRVDVVVSSTGIADYYLRQLGLTERIRRLPAEIERVPSYLAFAKSSPRAHLAPAFEETLARLKASERYRQILTEHGLGDGR